LKSSISSRIGGATPDDLHRLAGRARDVSRVARYANHLADWIHAVEQAAGEGFIDDRDAQSDCSGLLASRELAAFEKSQSQRSEVVSTDRPKGARPGASWGLTPV
jgi:hypothetical protein